MTELSFSDWDDLTQQISGCARCALCHSRTQAVPGVGSRQAEIMFIGEGPGKDEDAKGEPFVGAAGKFLTQMLGEIGMKREDVYITNVVKCRPPNNREPMEWEIEACNPYLVQQIKWIKPKIICTLGRYSMGLFLPGLKISECHGQAKRARGPCGQARQVYFPLYHPAVALYNGGMRSVLQRDMQKLPIY